MKKKIYIVITGGAGFVGSNLIEYLLENTNLKIISLDN
jgi:UDP-glucose 4-epimerase